MTDAPDGGRIRAVYNRLRCAMFCAAMTSFGSITYHYERCNTPEAEEHRRVYCYLYPRQQHESSAKKCDVDHS